MRRFHSPSLILIVLASFLAFTFAQCGPSASTRHLDKYDELPYRETFTLSGSTQTIYRAAIRSLQAEGYFISLSDPQTGLINAELNSGEVLLEETKEAGTGQSSGPGLFWTIIGIIFLFGLIAMILGSEDSEEEQRSERSRRPEHEPSVGISVEDSKTTSYRYVVTINTSELDGTSTEVHISAIRMELANGGVVQSRRMQNKYLNYRLVEGIERTLDR